MKMRWFYLVSVFVFAATACAQSGARDVDLKAPDGLALKGTFYPAAKTGPGILLFHQCNRDRKTWTDLATKLAADGFHVLAIDNRGFGESGGDRFDKLTQEQATEVLKKWPGDMDAAYAYLVAQPNVDKFRIGAAGASCGVDNSIQLALRHPAVKSLVLLSGNTDEAGRSYLRQSIWLPVLSVASDDDFDAVPVMRWIMGFSNNPRTRFVEYRAAGHGTLMFAVEKGLEPTMIEWFEKTLRGAPLSPSAANVTPTKTTPVEQFWDLLTKPGGVAAAREFWNEAKKRDPNVFLFPETAVNSYGYEKLQTGAVKEAVEIFKLNVEAFPESANVYDSLADAYDAAGEKQLAISASEKTLELLRTNPPRSGPRADLIRQSSEQRLKKLRGDT